MVAKRTFALAVALAFVAGATASGDHDDHDHATTEHVYGGVCAERNWTACAIRVPLADQADATCSCFESPDIVPQAKAKAFFALNYVSLFVSLLMVFAWTKIPAKQKYPNNLIMHSFIMCALCHSTIVLTPLVDGTTSFGAYDTAGNTNVLVRKNAAVCGIQAFFIYYGYMGLGWINACICYTLYYATVKAKQMPTLAPMSKKQVTLTYAMPLFVGIPTLFADSNTYALYCAVVQPMYVRNFFYIPFILTAVGSAPFIGPVVKTVYGMMRDGAKKAGGSGGLRVHALDLAGTKLWTFADSTAVLAVDAELALLQQENGVMRDQLTEVQRENARMERENAQLHQRLAAIEARLASL